jgi:hypothetical protein
MMMIMNSDEEEEAVCPKSVGRPRSTFLPENDAVMKAKVDEMRMLDTSWADIAKEFNASVSELSRWRNYTGYVDPRNCSLSES